jgi:hypothetical protein
MHGSWYLTAWAALQSISLVSITIATFSDLAVNFYLKIFRQETYIKVQLLAIIKFMLRYADGKHSRNTENDVNQDLHTAVTTLTAAAVQYTKSPSSTLSMTAIATSRRCIPKVDSRSRSGPVEEALFSPQRRTS